jgi:hypothetical protein
MLQLSASVALLALALVVLPSGARGWRVGEAPGAQAPSLRSAAARTVQGGGLGRNGAGAAFQLLPGILPAASSVLRGSKAGLHIAASGRHPARIHLAQSSRRYDAVPCK